jgi:hypothetical protein
VSQPPPYAPVHSFISDVTTGTFPGQALDVEFNDVKATTDAINANLKLIQRDDGQIANASIGYDQLSPALQTNGLATASSWLTGVNYTVGATVYQSSQLYRCLIAHTSAVFAADLTAARWLLLVALPAGATGSAGAAGTAATIAIGTTTTLSAGSAATVTNTGTSTAAILNIGVPQGIQGAIGPTGPAYGGTSATSLLIANSVTKTFTTQAGLAYQVGSYVRASSAANGANFMEGLVSSYSGLTLAIAVTVIGGAGTFADWGFATAGVPGTVGVATIAGNTGAFTLSHGLTNSTNDIQLSLTNASLEASVAAPTATTSNPGVMMGCGATCHITPRYSGRVNVRFDFTVVGAANVVSTHGVRYGTGTAPVNGAALTGTLLGSLGTVFTGPATVPGGETTVSKGGVITGLTPGTAYWFDITASSNNGTSVAVTNVDCAAFEF